MSELMAAQLTRAVEDLTKALRTLISDMDYRDRVAHGEMIGRGGAGGSGVPSTGSDWSPH